MGLDSVASSGTASSLTLEMPNLLNQCVNYRVRQCSFSGKWPYMQSLHDIMEMIAPG